MADATAPPPTYGAADGSSTPIMYPQPGVTLTQPVPQCPPPKYEPPKTGAYSEQPQYGGYQGQYPNTGGVTLIVRQSGFGPDPCTIECPNCRAVVTTHTQYNAGALTWLTAGLMCVLGCWAGCCLIPFCINDLHDVEHRCPNCGRTIGTYVRL